MNASNPLPRARVEDVVVQEVNDETLVFDRQTRQAHCLNRLAAVVWRHCDGHRTREEVAAIIARQLAVPVDTQLVELAVEELGQARLLEGLEPASPEQKRYTRREAARRLGVALPQPCS